MFREAGFSSIALAKEWCHQRINAVAHKIEEDKKYRTTKKHRKRHPHAGSPCPRCGRLVSWRVFPQLPPTYRLSWFHPCVDGVFARVVADGRLYLGPWPLRALPRTARICVNEQGTAYSVLHIDEQDPTPT